MLVRIIILLLLFSCVKESIPLQVELDWLEESEIITIGSEFEISCNLVSQFEYEVIIYREGKAVNIYYLNDDLPSIVLENCSFKIINKTQSKGLFYIKI